MGLGGGGGLGRGVAKVGPFHSFSATVCSNYPYFKMNDINLITKPFFLLFFFLSSGDMTFFSHLTSTVSTEGKVNIYFWLFRSVLTP